jgi:tRNA (mo5U34)-methyltransferase
MPSQRVTLSSELAAELDRDMGWMYPWQFGPGVVAPVLHPELPEVHATRAELIEPAVRRALEEAGPASTGLDLACAEGYFAQRLLEWGASRVVAVDLRDINVRRATLARDHFGIRPERLEVRLADLFRLDPRELGCFDVVLLLGLIYHVEDPIGALRIARACTRRLCVIETQLTRQREPIAHTWGTAGVVIETAASFAARLEPDATWNPGASDEGVLSLIPNRAALELALRAAGFSGFDVLDAEPRHNAQYRVGDRAVALAWP